MSFYGILSLAPLLLLLVAILGWWMDRQLLEKGLTSQIGTIVGEQGSALIQHALASAKEPKQGLIASVVGFAVLVSGATGVFGELQAAFERMWVSGSATVAEQKWWYSASLRLRGVGYVLAFGFLLLVSLAISTLLNLASGWAGSRLALEQAVRVLSEVLAFAICAALFFGLMRMSAGPQAALAQPGFRRHRRRHAVHGRAPGAGGLPVERGGGLGLWRGRLAGGAADVDLFFVGGAAVRRRLRQGGR